MAWIDVNDAVADLVHARNQAGFAARPIQLEPAAFLPLIPVRDGDLHWALASILDGFAASLEHLRGDLRLRVSLVSAGPETGEDPGHGISIDWSCVLDRRGLASVEKALARSLQAPGVGPGCPLRVAWGVEAPGQAGSPPGSATVNIRMTCQLQSYALPGEERMGSRDTLAATILVVEDDHTLRQCMVEYLALIGHPSLEACNGIEAVEMVERHGPSLGLVFMDIDMPLMTGLEAIQRLEGAFPLSRIVVMSGADVDLSAIRGGRNALHGVIQKPFSLKEIFSAISRFETKSLAS